jgi:hypothetical protein
MKRRCFCVECLYIGSTVVSHSVAIVLNVTRDRIGAVLPDVVAIFRARAAAASRRAIGSSRSYRSTRLDVPSLRSGAITLRIVGPLFAVGRCRCDLCAIGAKTTSAHFDRPMADLP